MDPVLVRHIAREEIRDAVRVLAELVTWNAGGCEGDLSEKAEKMLDEWMGSR